MSGMLLLNGDMDTLVIFLNRTNMRPAQENWIGNMAGYDMMVITLKGLEIYYLSWGIRVT